MHEYRNMDKCVSTDVYGCTHANNSGKVLKAISHFPTPHVSDPNSHDQPLALAGLLLQAPALRSEF